MLLFGISLVILGVLAAPSLLLSKKPDAKELIDKIAPYQGWIGIISCFLGIFGIVSLLLNRIGFTYTPLLWLIGLASTVLMTLLGFILGYGLINEHLLSKSDEAKAKAKEVLSKLRPIQGKLGLAGIILGAFYIVLLIVK